MNGVLAPTHDPGSPTPPPQGPPPLPVGASLTYRGPASPSQVLSGLTLSPPRPQPPSPLSSPSQAGFLKELSLPFSPHSLLTPRPLTLLLPPLQHRIRPAPAALLSPFSGRLLLRFLSAHPADPACPQELAQASSLLSGCSSCVLFSSSHQSHHRGRPTCLQLRPLTPLSPTSPTLCAQFEAEHLHLAGPQLPPPRCCRSLLLSSRVPRPEIRYHF